MSSSVMPCTPSRLLGSWRSVRSLLRRRFRPARSSAPARRRPAHSIVSRPPRVSTSTRASSRPRRMPATTAAQAPVPQASVSPAPRSYTRRRIVRARDDLHEAGVDALREARRAFSISGPCVATGAASTSSTHLHRVRIAHRQHAPPRRCGPRRARAARAAKPPSVARGVEPGGVERHRGRLEDRARPCRP